MKIKTYRFAAALAVLLALALVFAAPVSAEESVAKIDSTGYATLKAAVDAASGGQTVTLLKDVTSSEKIEIKTAITLDGNGYTLTSTADRAINVDCSGAVTIKNLTVATNTPYYSESEYPERAINIINEAVTLTLNNVTAEGFMYTINVAASSEGSSITIIDGKYSGYSALNICGNDTVVVANNVVFHGNNTAPYGTSNAFAAISIGDYAHSHYSDNVSITIKGGKITVDSTNGNRQFIVSAPGVTNSKIVIDSDLDILNNDVFNAATEEVAGTFPAEYAGELGNSDYEAAIVNGSLIDVYDYLKEAVDASKAGDTITLLNDVVVEKEIVIPVDKDSITLEGNNHKITASSVVSQESLGGFTSDQCIMEIRGDHFTMKNVTLDYSGATIDSGRSLSTIALFGENAILEKNIIKAGTNQKHRSTAILIYASANDTILKNNEIILGSSARTDESSKHRNESVGIRIYPYKVGYTPTIPTDNLSITGNTITKSSGTNPQVGILIDGAQSGDELIVTGNTFDLGNSGIILETMTNASMVPAPSLSMTFTDNTFTSSKNFLYVVKDEWGQSDFTQTLVLNDGNISVTTNTTISSLTGTSGDLTLNGGTVYNLTVGDGSLTISDGTFTGAVSVETGASLFITGGLFSSQPDASYIKSGYEVVPSGGKFKVQEKKQVTTTTTTTTTTTKPKEEPPVEEPETPTEPVAGEVTVETEVTDGGEVELEAPVEEPVEGEGGASAVDEEEAKITAVVLPTGTEGKVEFIPVSEQPAPAGKETQTKKVFEINVPEYEKGKPATIKFTMTVAELEADGKSAADVALWHFDEETGEWTKLVTSYIIVDGVVYFEAITNDFSPFAIIYEETPVDEPVEEPETPASPAPVLGLLAALGAAVVLRRK